MNHLKQANNSRIPIVTLSLAALMVVLTNVWFLVGLCVPATNCHPDWRTLSGFASLMVWLIVAAFVHTSFPQLVSDLVVFVFLGSLVEVWIKPLPTKTRYQILLAGYGGTAFVNLLAFFKGGSGAGASFWDYMLLGVPFYYWLKSHNEIKWYWSYVILGGFVLVLIPFGEMVFYRLIVTSIVHGTGIWYGFLIAYILRKTDLL